MKARYDRYGKPMPTVESKPLANLKTRLPKENKVITEAGLNLYRQVDTSQDSNAESTDSQDIAQHQRKMEREKKKNAILMQQGNIKYYNEDDVQVHIDERLANLDAFYFDWKIPKEKRLEEFKANVVNRGF